MALTRDQFDVIANSYNDRQLNNKIKLKKKNNKNILCKIFR